jgi:hypothetical protein
MHWLFDHKCTYRRWGITPRPEKVATGSVGEYTKKNSNFKDGLWQLSYPLAPVDKQATTGAQIPREYQSVLAGSRYWPAVTLKRILLGW